MNIKRLLRLVVIATATAAAVSCGTTQEYVLLNDVVTPHEYGAPKRQDLHIKRGDELQILVAHHIPQLIEAFNKRVSDDDNSNSINTYNVNSEGYISFPIFDTIKVLGMTCRELENYLEQRIDSEGLASHPTVHVKIKNFRVTVIGESGAGVFEFDDENVTILDLLARANLMGGGGGGGTAIRRDKILVVRDCDSSLRTDFISLLSTDIIYSPYYYLQQNDMVYVYPSKVTIRNSNRLFDYWLARLSVVSTAVSVGTLIINLFTTKSK